MRRNFRRTPPVFRVGDKVVTPAGEGVIKHIYPGGLHIANSYCVDLPRKLRGVLFEEHKLRSIAKDAAQR